MDILMPRMDGMAATRAIRALGGAVSEIPIVAVTTAAAPGEVLRYLSVGMTVVVAKPVELVALAEAIAERPSRPLDRRRRAQPRLEQPCTLRDARFAATPQDKARRVEASAGLRHGEGARRARLGSRLLMRWVTIRIREGGSLSGATAMACSRMARIQVERLPVGWKSKL